MDVPRFELLAGVACILRRRVVSYRRKMADDRHF